jgi:hypothetical protein
MIRTMDSMDQASPWGKTGTEEQEGGVKTTRGTEREPLRDCWAMCFIGVLCPPLLASQFL